jgi:hypothetical protein
MPPAELLEAVARALPEYLGTMNRLLLADAALAIVREALREPSEAMLDGYWHQAGESREMRPRTHVSARHYWRAMFAASALGGGDE